MKILHVIDSGGMYGAETMLINLMAEQQKMGITPVLASIGDKKTGHKAVEKAAEDIGVRVEAFRMRPGPNYLGAARILKFAHKEKFSILHSHGYKGNILFGLIPRSLRKIPMITSLHGYTSTAGQTNKGFSKMRAYEWLDAVSLRFIDRVVLVNRAMAYHPRLKNLPVNFSVVNNGIPPANQGTLSSAQNLDQDIRDFCSSGFILCAVGRLSWEKGFDILLEALKMAARENSDLKLIIMGEGGKRPVLEKQVKSLGLSERVMLAGFRPSAKSYFHLMDALVLSSHTEGLPMVALEAMQAGLPVIATKVGGLPELLDQGRAGMLVEKNSPESLSHAILKTAESPSLREQLADQGRKRVTESYSSTAMARGYLEIYNNVICCVKAFSLKTGNNKYIRKKPYIQRAKHTAKKLVTSSGFLTDCLNAFSAKYPKVLIYHRFAGLGSRETHKLGADVFRRQLEWIAGNFTVLSMEELVEHFNRKGSWPEKVVTITVDDGYRDFYQHAYPELKRLSLPATFFVTVNFVDKKTMLWHDRLRYAIQHTVYKNLDLNLAGRLQKFPITDSQEKLAAWKFLSDFCIASPDHEKWEVISLVESALQVTPPETAPQEYAPATWEELRQMSDNGIEIGSHTLNHPILSKIPSERLADEISASRHILEEKLNKPVYTFSYPNGTPADISKQAVSAVKKAGYKGAAVTAGLTPKDPFLIPRMGASEDRTEFAAKLHGLEYAGKLLRKKRFPVV
ncbi:MAG: glycosyltransferase [Desulfobacterales bacterium]